MTDTQTIVDGLKKDPVWRGLVDGLQTTAVYKPLGFKRIIVLGWMGTGKTTLALSIPRAIIFDTEGSAEELKPVHDSSVKVPISDYGEFDKYLKALEASAKQGRRPFDTVVIDSLDAFGGSQTSLIAEYVVREKDTDYISEFGQKGAGWGRLIELFAKSLLRIQMAGYGCFSTCHLRRKTIELPSGGYKPMITRSLTARTDEVAFGRAQHVLHVMKSRQRKPTYSEIGVGGKKRVVETGEKFAAVHKMIFASDDPEMERNLKQRVGLSEEIVFNPDNGWELFEAAYNKVTGITK